MTARRENPIEGAVSAVVIAAAALIVGERVVRAVCLIGWLVWRAIA